eukprot:Skav226728  [mRNA]  locus=scaffold720:109991:111202:+ [translate_table: standard]
MPRNHGRFTCVFKVSEPKPTKMRPHVLQIEKIVRYPAQDACGFLVAASTIWLKLFESSKPAPCTAMNT